MKIKRFNENQQSDLTNERASEIIDELEEIYEFISNKDKYLDSLINELKNSKSESSKNNDQIDDSYITLDLLKNELSISKIKIEKVLDNLKSYLDDGREIIKTKYF